MNKLDSFFTSSDVFKVNFSSCPVQATLGVLGHKWTLLILRNIGLFRAQRFNEMLKVTPGLTKRVLSIRLKELERENFIHLIDKKQNYAKWDLTEKGKDSLGILMVMVQFGSKYYAPKVFQDKHPRNLDDVFEMSYIHDIMSRVIPEYSTMDNYLRNKQEGPTKVKSSIP